MTLHKVHVTRLALKRVEADCCIYFLNVSKCLGQDDLWEVTTYSDYLANKLVEEENKVHEN